MMPRHPLVALLVLCAAGCSRTGAGPAVLDPRADADTRMTAIAARFEADRNRGGMSGVIADIEGCYASAVRPVTRVYALRDCLVLDYVAYKTDVAVGRGAYGQGLPYFSDQTATQRWGRYGPLAQFDSPQRLLRYLDDANGLVQLRLQRPGQ